MVRPKVSAVEPKAQRVNEQIRVGEVRVIGADGAQLGIITTREALEAAQRANEGAGARCVGLSLETRPDEVDAAEALRMRRLGATEVQIGVQVAGDQAAILTSAAAGGQARYSDFALIFRRHLDLNRLAAEQPLTEPPGQHLLADPARTMEQIGVWQAITGHRPPDRFLGMALVLDIK